MPIGSPDGLRPVGRFVLDAEPSTPVVRGAILKFVLWEDGSSNEPRTAPFAFLEDGVEQHG